MRLVESVPSTGALKVDRAAGIIFSCRILGPESKNTYGERDVICTEYAPSAHADAVRLYESKACNLNHLGARKERDVRDTFGVIRKPFTRTTAGRPVTYGDLHYLKSHPMAEVIAEAAERGLPCFGFSHDAYSGKERRDRVRKRLVIESLTSVKSIDLVYNPATNRSLVESLDSETWTMPLVAEYVPAQDWKEFAKRIRAGW